MKRKYIPYILVFPLLLAVTGILLTFVPSDISPDEYLKEMFGESHIIVLSDPKTHGKKYCYIAYESLEKTSESATIFPLEQTGGLYTNSDKYSCTLDKESYLTDEMLNVQISNSGSYDLVWESNDYILDVMLNGQWYVIGIGELKKRGSEMCCVVDKNMKMQIDLSRTGNCGLRPGQYRFRIHVRFRTDDDASEFKKELFDDGFWLYQEFNVTK